MLVSQMFSRVLIETGQFFIAEETIELDQVRFVTLVRATLGTYNNYFPIDCRDQIDTCGNRYYKFLDSSSKFGGLGVPAWISDVIPVRLFGISPFGGIMNQIGLQSTTGLGSGQSNPYLIQKCLFPWRYDKKEDQTLYLPASGEFDVRAVFHHKVTMVDDANSNTPDSWEVKSIDDGSGTFFKLLAGKFLIALASSRRAFTINDLPVTADAEQLVDDGKTMVQEAVDNLHNNHNKFYLAWR